MRRGLIGPVMAMARPRRPAAEAALVRAAAGSTGCASERAARLAGRVVAEAFAAIDNPEPEPIIALLRQLSDANVLRLATDAEIDTCALIRAERAARAEARGGRRLPQSAWAAEDQDISKAVSATLATRYRRILRD